MNQVNKKVLAISFLLFLEICLFNVFKSEFWLSIRGPLFTGLIISLAITFPELNFNKIKAWFTNINKN
jgi:hypothetical protein